MLRKGRWRELGEKFLFHKPSIFILSTLKGHLKVQCAHKVFSFGGKEVKPVATSWRVAHNMYTSLELSQNHQRIFVHHFLEESAVEHVSMQLTKMSAFPQLGFDGEGPV